MDFSEVPLSPETLCRDVLDLCQEPGETGCVLLQSLADRERVVGEEENMLDLLQTFSPHREVHYSLRHTQTDDVTSSGAGEAQDEFVTERETVRRLREKAQLHETKLKQIRATRGAGESRRVHSVRSEEVQQISALFQLKQEELVVATATVQRLTNQLQSLRSRRFDGQFKAHLQRELQIRARNQDRGQGVPHHRDPELTERRLNQLRQKLRNRRNQRRNPVCPPGPSVPWGSGPDPGLLLQGLAQGPHLAAGSRVAAVGPYLESSCRPPESELKPPPRPAKTVPAASEAPPPLPARTNHRNFNMDSPPPVPLRTNHSEDLQRRSNTPDRYLLIPQIGVVSAKHDSDAAVVPPPLPRKSSGSSFRSSTLPLPKHRTPPSAAVRPLTPDHDQAPPPILHRPPTVTAASIRSLYTSGGVGGAGGVTQYQPGHGTLPRSKPRAQSKPTGHRSDTEFGFGDYSESVSVAMHREEEVPRPRPLSPTKLLPFLSGGLRAGLLNAPRPLKKRSSLCEPESAPQLLRIRYQRTALDGQRTALTALDGQMTAQTVLDSQRTLVGGRTTKTTRAGQRTTLTTQDKEIDQTSTAKDGVDAVEETAEPKDLPLDLIKAESPKSPPPLPPRMPMNDSAHRQRQAPPTPTKKCHQNETSLQPPHSPTKILKSILRAPGSGRTTDVLRVWFNPVCLLLDSALEGEFDLVQRVIYEVPDPSVANDEGITALHNAVCAGHTDIVKFLVQFGVNVNAADSDGWTPLHCAASCNNTQVCKLLVESGAAVFACTHSDSQTPAEKCEEQEEGYAQCSQFLYGVQEKIGVMNRSQVFALWDFEPREADEIQIFEGDCLTVLDRDRSGDSLWWWVRAANKEGNVPRNLLGVYPRIKPRQRSLA